MKQTHVSAGGSGHQRAGSLADPYGGPGKRTLTEALPPVGSGQAMPAAVQAKMEAAFGADFSAVRIHEGPRAPALGARAFAQGTDLHFAPGAYQPDSTRGQELLGHELAHVVQQSQGRVAATTQAKGMGVNEDSSLEREADEHGARAARGESIGGAPGERRSIGGAAHAPVQRVPIGIDDLETTVPDNRARVLSYLRDCGPGQLEDILQRMVVENDPRNIEYVQIIRRELARHAGLQQIDEITHEEGGVWTSATVFYEKQVAYTSPPARNGEDAPHDHYGFGAHEDHESEMSIADSEVTTITSVENFLQQQLHNYHTGAHIGRRIDILVVGNMGPCDGCKTRLQRFIGTCRQFWPFVNFSLEVNYTTRPNNVWRGGIQTTYGNHNDGARTATGGRPYFHHTF